MKDTSEDETSLSEWVSQLTNCGWASDKWFNYLHLFSISITTWPLAFVMVLGEWMLIDANCFTFLEQYLLLYVFHRKPSWKSRTIQEYSLYNDDEDSTLCSSDLKRGEIMHFRYVMTLSSPIVKESCGLLHGTRKGWQGRELLRLFLLLAGFF